MKRVIGIVVIGALAALCIGSLALAAKEQARCESCGMFWDKSSTRISASIELSGKTADHKFESLGCLHSKLSEWGSKASLKGLKVLDYSTLGSKSETMVDGKKAYFLFGTSELKGSMPEYVAAFGSKKSAEKAKASLGGELLDWPSTWKKFGSEGGATPSCGCKACAKKGVACDNCADCKAKGGCECCKDKDKS